MFITDSLCYRLSSNISQTSHACHIVALSLVGSLLWFNVHCRCVWHWKTTHMVCKASAYMAVFITQTSQLTDKWVSSLAYNFATRDPPTLPAEWKSDHVQCGWGVNYSHLWQLSCSWPRVTYVLGGGWDPSNRVDTCFEPQQSIPTEVERELEFPQLSKAPCLL
jgi:hypothetical protein